MSYAADTTVSVVRSRTEIEELLRKHGASAIASGWEGGQSVIQCRIHDRILRFRVRMPQRSEYQRTATGRIRTTIQIDQAVAQGERQRWRALLLVIKAKLEAVESGIETFDEAFLSNVVLANGQTMAEWAVPELDAHPNGWQPTSLLALGPGA